MTTTEIVYKALTEWELSNRERICSYELCKVLTSHLSINALWSESTVLRYISEHMNEWKAWEQREI